MKNLIPVLMGAAAIIAAITSAVAQAHGAFIGNAWLRPPYVYGYAATAILSLIAIITGINTNRAEDKSTADEKHKEIKNRMAALLTRERELFAALKAAPDNAHYTDAIRKADDWVNETVALLRDADQPTDAEELRQIGYAELSSEYL